MLWNSTRILGKGRNYMPKGMKELAVLGIKAALATTPFCGGVAEFFGWAVEGRFVERRLVEIETLLGEETESFLQNLQGLNEHDYYAVRKILKFHCYEAFPELTSTTAKVIIDYVMNRQNRVGDDQIIEMLCQLNASDIIALKTIKKAIIQKGNSDYTKVVDWSDVSPFRLSDPEGKFKMSDMVLAKFEREEGCETPDFSEALNALAISFSKLDRLKIISAYHQIYSGMNNSFDIDQFLITPFGVRIFGFIDLDDEGGN